MMVHKLPLFLFLLLLVPHPSEAADDNQLWTSARVRYTSPEKAKLELIQHVRWDQNASSLLSAMPEFRVKLSPTKGGSIGVGYRLMHKRSGSGDFETAHRVHLSGEYERSFGPIEAAYRLRGQTRYEPDAERFDTTIRNRLGLRVPTDSQFTPLLSMESFVDHTDEGLLHSKIRSAIGTAIRLTKAHRLKVRYLHESPLDDPKEIEHILAVDYQYRYYAASD